MKEKIKIFALANAIKYNGKANTGSIIGKILKELPEVKKNLKKYITEINCIIKEVNNLKLEEQKKILLEIAPEILNKKKVVEIKEVPSLKNVTNKVVMRFAPSPSGPTHIGHAHCMLLNSEIARKYKGKFILRIEDTNPENIYPPAYKMIPEEVKWLTKNNVNKIIIQSERMELYYKYAEELFSKGALYICTCNREEFRELIKQKKECKCRSLKIDEQIKRWEKMFTEYKTGEAVVRVKTDLKHKNPALRDFPVWRINDTIHPRTKNKYRVWPLMNFSVFVDDVECKVTHIIRAKDHQTNEKRQQYLYKYLNKKIPETMFIGMTNFTDIKLSSTETRKEIEEGKFNGWDDIRLPFVSALRRKGYQPEAFMKYAVHMGISKNDKKVSKQEFFKLLNAYNKQVIDSTASRFFFVHNPVQIFITNAPTRNLNLNLHPDLNKGGRKFTCRNTFFLNKKDIDSIKNNGIYRLMDNLNFKKIEETYIFDSTSYENYRKVGRGLFHWVTENNVNVEILMNDGKIIKGIAEKNIENMKIGEICQFQRFGFCRLDTIQNNKYKFWFTHK